MYCSKCGGVVSEGQELCSRCGHSTNNALGTQSAEAVELSRFRRTVRRLSRFWFLFAGLNVVLGVMGIFADQTGLWMHTGPWEPWPHPYIWNWTLVGSAAWTLLSLRIVAAAAAGWGMSRLTDWSRLMSLIASCLAFLEFPIGFALAVYAFSVLLGKHHALLYSRLGPHESPAAVR